MAIKEVGILDQIFKFGDGDKGSLFVTKGEAEAFIRTAWAVACQVAPDTAFENFRWAFYNKVPGFDPTYGDDREALEGIAPSQMTKAAKGLLKNTKATW